MPLAAAEKVTVAPAKTVWLTGWVVITGGVAGFTVSVAGLVVAGPPRLVNTASYSFPLSAVVVLAMNNVSLFAPDAGEKAPHDRWRPAIAPSGGNASGRSCEAHALARKDSLADRLGGDDRRCGWVHGERFAAGRRHWPMKNPHGAFQH